MLIESDQQNYLSGEEGGLAPAAVSITPSCCNACGGALVPRFPAVLDPQTREYFSIAVCRACGLGHTMPQPADLSHYYGSAYHVGRHGFTADYCARRRLRLVTAAASEGNGRRLLDIGCGDGTFLLAARDRKGWNVSGTEMNPATARMAGLNVYETIEEAQEAADAPFDCITLWHSLEHLRDPRATLTQLAGSLKLDGGVLVVAVPDAGGLQAGVFRSGWFHLDVPRHLYHFNERSLRHLLEATGFSIERCWHQEFEYDLLGWSQSALNLMFPTPNLFFNRLTGRRTDAGKVETAASHLFGLALSALALPAVAIGTLARRGGTLIAVARRRTNAI
jgi:SAM-dependent methyltransferase